MPEPENRIRRSGRNLRKNELKKETLVCLKNVALIRGGKKVLRGIDWTVRSGEHWFVLGMNGSGKTSLLETLLGYLWPSKGSVEVLNEGYGKTYLPELRKKIGYVAPWIYQRIQDSETVREAVASGREGGVRFYRKFSPRLNAEILKQLRRMESAHLISARFGDLSSGEQLKVLIARALIAEPRVLIFDEPFSQLDIGSRVHIYRLLRKICSSQRGPSVILVTHQLEDIGTIFTHGLLLKDGKIADAGKKSEVLTSGRLSAAFNVPVHVRYAHGKYLLADSGPA